MKRKQDPRIEYRKQTIRRLMVALRTSTDEVFRERALWIIEQKKTDIEQIVAGTYPTTDIASQPD